MCLKTIISKARSRAHRKTTPNIEKKMTGSGG